MGSQEVIGLGPYNGKIPLNPTLIDESSLKECNRIKFVYTAAGIITLQSQFLVPSFLVPKRSRVAVFDNCFKSDSYINCRDSSQPPD